MTPAGALTTLVKFTGTNGRAPRSSLIQAKDGNFYGTTAVGGSGCGTGGCGTVFRMTPTGSLTTLLNFTGTNGNNPGYAALIQAKDGNFYGTTFTGGLNNLGTVFKMTSTGTLTTLVNFGSQPDGNQPQASLIQTSDGKFYGTTRNGGSGLRGTVFRIP
jgi:uncharacterized repeat protein (TIGR03803 family)